MNIGYILIAGRRTTHNPFSSRDKPWDPYGIAKFDLSGLLLGQTYLYLRSPIHCCPLPDTHSGLQKPDGPIVGQPGNVDGPGTVSENNFYARHIGSRDCLISRFERLVSRDKNLFSREVRIVETLVEFLFYKGMDLKVIATLLQMFISSKKK